MNKKLLNKFSLCFFNTIMRLNNVRAFSESICLNFCAINNPLNIPFFNFTNSIISRAGGYSHISERWVLA
jgi:hypothetical protein